MRFLVFTSPTPGGLKTPPTAAAFAAQTDWFRARISDGAIEHAWHGEDRAVFVFNAETREALDAMIAAVPLRDLMKVEVEALIEFEAHTARVQKYLDAAERG